MNKVAIAAAAVLFSAVLFVGCAGGYKDGTYKAQAAEFEHGWKDYLIIEVADGKATVKEFDALNESGGKKSQDADYRAAMEPAMGTYPQKYITDIIAEFTDKGDVSKMDGITGATRSANSFKALMNAALEKARSGDTTPAIPGDSSK